MAAPPLFLRVYAIILIVLLVLCPNAFGLIAVGSISQLSGAPKFTRAGQTLPATPAMAVDLLDQFTTAECRHYLAHTGYV